MFETTPTTVLVVEDEVLIRMDLVDTLEGAGFRTHEAGNSADAILILEAHPEIRVVFTDIQMPGGMDGLALAHYVRDRWPPTVIVICSANRHPAEADMPTDSSFMAKPYYPARLAAMLDKVRRQLAA